MRKTLDKSVFWVCLINAYKLNEKGEIKKLGLLHLRNYNHFLYSCFVNLHSKDSCQMMDVMV